MNRFVWVLSLVSAVAFAAGQESALILKTTKDGKLAAPQDCGQLEARGPAAGDKDVLTLVFQDPDGKQAAPVAGLELATGGQPLTPTPLGKSLQVPYTGAVDVKAAGKTVCTVTAPAPKAAEPATKPPGGSGSGGDNQPPPASGADVFQLDQQARDYLSSRGITGHKFEGSTFTLYHLPSGKLAFAPPDHIEEGQSIAAVVIIPEDAVPLLEVTACGKVQQFRLHGDFNAVLDTVKGVIKMQSKPKAAAVQFVPYAFTDRMKCADSVSYKITVARADGTSASSSTTITIESVYQFAIGAAAIYDLGAPAQVSLKDRLTPAGDATEKFVSKTNPVTGLRGIVTLGWHPFGANYDNWRLKNWLEIIVGVDPGRLTSGFVFGINLSFMPQLGIVGGISVYQSQVIEPGINASPGDTWRVPGDLSTRSAFNSESIGAFFGLHASSDLLAALFPKKT